MCAAPPTYRLDELGWLQFERLCELVLRAEAGVEPRAWQGHADRWRATIVPGPLVLARRGLRLRGPAAIAVLWSASGEATTEALSALGERLTTMLVTLAQERHEPLLVFSNLDSRSAGDSLRAAAGLGIELSLLGAGEISESIDAHAQIRSELPSLLGLRELEPLIGVEQRERSLFDLAEAQRLARVFWPTRAYQRAREVLAEHGLAVLSGPPELGKTAIAQMLALAALTDGWEAHACTDPDQVSAAFDASRRQLFIADDAFGSTEYRPDAAERWARALQGMLGMLDQRHWLIWTSRPAPLRAALARIRLERAAPRLPAAAAVLVDAGDLDLRERTLILFRHARAQPEASVRSALRAAGVFLVEHPHFTPERIRRLVADEALRDVCAGDQAARLALVDRLLTAPSEAMRVSLAALSAEQRDLLVALLDAPAGLIDERELSATLRRHHPGGLSRQPAQLIDRLTDHFLRVTPLGIGWVHPSWRDLVIDELCHDASGRQRFLAACGVDGVLLALSGHGGARGERSLPLLADDRDWDMLSDRLQGLVRELEPRDCARVLLALEQAASDAADAAGLREANALALTFLEAARQLWDAQRVTLPAFLLEAWFELAGRVPGAPTRPALATTWERLHPGPLSPGSPEHDQLLRADEWLAVAEVLAARDPAALVALDFHERDRELLEQLIVGLTQLGAGDADARPLAESVLTRILHLCPELAPGARSALTLTELADDIDSRRWWTPEDLTQPGGLERRPDDGQLRRGEIRRVLSDL